MKIAKIAATALVSLIAGFILIISIVTAITNADTTGATTEAAITMAIVSVLVGGLFIVIIWLPWDKILKSQNE